MAAENHSRACRDVEFEPFDAVGRVEFVGDCEVVDILGDVGVAAEVGIVGRKDDFVFARGRQDAVVGE